MKRLTAISFVCVMLASTMSFTSFASECKEIDGFKGYAWGTTAKEIIEGEAAAGNRNYEMRGEDEDLAYTWLAYDQSEVGGFSCETDFIFVDDKLVMGGYVPHLFIDRNSSEMSGAANLLIDKYMEIYGEPYIHMDSEDGIPLIVWVDENKNLIELNAEVIVYATMDEEALEATNVFSPDENYGLGILEAINAMGNYDGI